MTKILQNIHRFGWFFGGKIELPCGVKARKNRRCHIYTVVIFNCCTDKVERRCPVFVFKSFGVTNVRGSMLIEYAERKRHQKKILANSRQVHFLLTNLPFALVVSVVTISAKFESIQKNNKITQNCTFNSIFFSLFDIDFHPWTVDQRIWNDAIRHSNLYT